MVFGKVSANFKPMRNSFRVAPFAKANGMKRKRAALTDDGSGNPKKQLKGGVLPSASSTGSHKDQFKGYDLRQVPKEAWPQQKQNKGNHGYTLSAANGAVTCSHEVNAHEIYRDEPPTCSS